MRSTTPSKSEDVVSVVPAVALTQYIVTHAPLELSVRRPASSLGCSVHGRLRPPSYVDRTATDAAGTHGAAPGSHPVRSSITMGAVVHTVLVVVQSAPGAAHE